MLGLLLESQPRRQRRTGGATTSVAFHVAVVGLVAATTAHIPGRSRPVAILPLVRLPVIQRALVNEPPARAALGSPTLNVPIPDARRVTLRAIPTNLPPIDMGRAAEAVAAPFEFVSPGGSALGPRGIVTRDSDEPDRWTAREAALRLISNARPRYPESLRGAGIAGRVVVRFVVDTAGRVDVGSATVLESTHVLFTRAVLDVLPSLRFLPTESNGARIRALAEMPFEFVLR